MRAGLTQAQLAAGLAISQPYLAQREAGKGTGDVTLYARLSEAFGFASRILCRATARPREAWPTRGARNDLGPLAPWGYVFAPLNFVRIPHR